jgi:predicted ATPase
VLTSITAQNFKSFGEEQTIPLQPITVLVGPNNSGKSNLVSLARFVRNAARNAERTGSGEKAFEEEGGVGFVFRRPAVGDGRMRVGWTAHGGEDAEGSYISELAREGQGPDVVQKKERLWGPNLGEAFDLEGDSLRLRRDQGAVALETPLAGLGMLVRRHDVSALASFRPVWAPIVHSREIKLAISALCQDAGVVSDPKLGEDGSGMPAVLGLWRGANLERADELDKLIHKCLPEIARVLVKPGPVPGEQRLWVQQTDGEQFDARHVSDGVLSFIALAMHAISAEPGALLFIEEPEQSIHPRRLHDLVELFRTIVYERKCQIVIVTHSPVLLHEFRDEPEAILLFRRDEQKGTRVNPLTDFPDLMEALHTREADPGDMLTNGFLTEPS